jgi:tetratricopeptide (TPR) repeat protein
MSIIRSWQHFQFIPSTLAAFALPGILASLVLQIAVPACAGEAPAAMAAMETKLSADADNLRLGSEYREIAIQSGEYDRAIAFLQQLVADHPDKANAHLNFGFAYVDKIPVAGSITQVILANNALQEFTKSIDLRKSWIALYTRGNSYLYWPKVFGRAPLGVADLEAAMKLQKADAKKSFYVRTYLALGDGYWKTDDETKAKQVWAEGLKEFPSNSSLKARMAAEGDDLQAIIDDTYDITKRVDTSLKELWGPDNATAQAGK